MPSISLDLSRIPVQRAGSKVAGPSGEVTVPRINTINVERPASEAPASSAADGAAAAAASIVTQIKPAAGSQFVLKPITAELIQDAQGASAAGAPQPDSVDIEGHDKFKGLKPGDVIVVEVAPDGSEKPVLVLDQREALKLFTDTAAPVQE